MQLSNPLHSLCRSMFNSQLSIYMKVSIILAITSTLLSQLGIATCGNTIVVNALPVLITGIQLSNAWCNVTNSANVDLAPSPAYPSGIYYMSSRICDRAGQSVKIFEGDFFNYSFDQFETYPCWGTRTSMSILAGYSRLIRFFSSNKFHDGDYLFYILPMITGDKKFATTTYYSNSSCDNIDGRQYWGNVNTCLSNPVQPFENQIQNLATESTYTYSSKMANECNDVNFTKVPFRECSSVMFNDTLFY